MTTATNEGVMAAFRQAFQAPPKPPNFPMFHESTDFLRNYKQAAIYVKKFETECAAYKVEDLYAAFKLVTGPKLELIEETMPEPETGSTWQKLKRQFLDFYQPAKMIATFRQDFHQAYQRNGETSVGFLLRLKELTPYCRFSESEDRVEKAKQELLSLVAQVATGSKVDKVKKAALKDDIVWKSLVEVAREQDAAQAQIHALDERKHIRKVFTQQAPFKNRSGYSKPAYADRPRSKDCGYCGNGMHDRSKCPAKLVKCAACEIIGHLKPVCRRKTDNKPFKKFVRVVQDNSEEEIEEEKQYVHHDEETYESDSSLDYEEQASGFVRHVSKQAY